ncbi:hypothetical protein ADILRU_1039 [Leifsonia rubra CMS 76R]|nr:hypothetical protein ADILRU_1039 [Leifsonia rubra CMS 76R]
MLLGLAVDNRKGLRWGVDNRALSAACDCAFRRNLGAVTVSAV